MNSKSQINDDTIDLRELFFSLIAQWKMIALCIILSVICGLLYLRITPEIFSTDAMVQVEDNKGAASAALLTARRTTYINSYFSRGILRQGV